MLLPSKGYHSVYSSGRDRCGRGDLYKGAINSIYSIHRSLQGSHFCKLSALLIYWIRRPVLREASRSRPSPGRSGRRGWVAPSTPTRSNPRRHGSHFSQLSACLPLIWSRFPATTPCPGRSDFGRDRPKRRSKGWLALLGGICEPSKGNFFSWR